MSETIVERPVSKSVEKRPLHLRRKRGWYIVQGILFLLAGILALLVPAMTVVAVELFLGALLAVCGVYQIYHGISDRSGWMSASGLLSLVIGGWMLLMPVTGAVAVATLIACFLIAESLAEFFLAYHLRQTRQWGWLVASGALSMVLGVVLLIGWPQQTLVLAGIYLGVNFLFYGAAILVIALNKHNKAFFNA